MPEYHKIKKKYEVFCILSRIAQKQKEYKRKRNETRKEALRREITDRQEKRRIIFDSSNFREQDYRNRRRIIYLFLT